MIQAHIDLILSIILILILIRRFHVSVAVFAGALLLCFLIGLNCLEILYKTIISIQTIKYLIIFTLAFTLAYSMKESGVLDELTISALSIFGRSSIVIIPAMIGLLPMPGGAIVSAILLKNVFEKFKVSSEKATFLNYWFRHIWACLDPIYPSVILILAILELNYPAMLKSTYPITVMMTLAGLPFIIGTPNVRNKDRNYKGLINLLPILTVIILTVLGIDLLYSLAISIIIFYLFKRPNLKSVARDVFNPRIYLLVIALLFYKEIILRSNSAEEFMRAITALGIPDVVVASTLSFIMGFATGIESGYAAIAIPLLSTFTGMGDEIVQKNLMLVVGFGIMGVMFSPLHLCLILTKEYYSANLEKVYTRYLIPSGILTLFSIYVLYYLS